MPPTPPEPRPLAFVSRQAGTAAAFGPLVDALERASGLELLASNLERFRESASEEAEAVHNTLGVFENCLDIRGAAATSETVAKSTVLVPWLARRVDVRATRHVYVTS